MAEKNQKLVIAILEFLEKSIVDGSVLEDNKKTIESAIRCIGEGFGVSHYDEAQRQKLSIKPVTLQSIFEVHLKGIAATPEATKATNGAPLNSSTSSAANKAQAEQLRIKGNGLMTSKDYVGAIAAYTSAITLDTTNALYYSNRAAAHSSRSDHREAVNDAQKAIQLDANMAHAYHRLGHAFYCLGEYQESAKAFQRGLDLDPNNINLKSARDQANARIPSASTPKPVPPTPAGGDGGQPDLFKGLGPLGGGSLGNIISSLMQNPEVMTMVRRLSVQNGGSGSPIGDPSINNIMNLLQSGGLGPLGGGNGGSIFASLMQSPQVMTIVQQLFAQNGGLGSPIGDPPVNSIMNLLQSGDLTSPMGGLMNNPAIMDIASMLMGGANTSGSGGA